MDKHKYTVAEIEFIKKHVVGKTSLDLTDLVNKEFDLNLRVSQIRAFMKNRSLQNGLNTRFQKDSKFGYEYRIQKGQHKSEATQFKKGQRSMNYKPVGSERIDRDGYILIKITDHGEWHKRWRHKHRILWEEHNGPVPKGKCLIFADSDKMNIKLENLILIDRSQLLIMNQNGLIMQDHDLTVTGILIAKVIDSGNKRKA